MTSLRFILLALATLAAGCAPQDDESYRKSWVRVELPGFSILLPPGKVVATSSVPSTGKHHRVIRSSFIDHWLNDTAMKGSAIAIWSNEPATFEEWKRDYLPAMLAGLESTAPGSKVIKEEFLDNDHWIFVIGTGRVPLALGTVRCDEHFQIQIMYAHYHDIARQVADMRDLMASVQCAVRAENRMKMRAATRLPAKLGEVSPSNPQEYRSLDGESLSLSFSAGNVLSNAKVYRTLVAQIVSTTFDVKVTDSDMELVTVPKVLRLEPHMLLKITVPDDKGRLYVGALYCEDMTLTLMSFWSAPQVSDNLAIERLSQVGCPDAPSTPSPTFESMVDAACQAGEAAACDIKSASAGS